MRTTLNWKNGNALTPAQQDAVFRKFTGTYNATDYRDRQHWLEESKFAVNTDGSLDARLTYYMLRGSKVHRLRPTTLIRTPAPNALAAHYRVAAYQNALAELDAARLSLEADLKEATATVEKVRRDSSSLLHSLHP